MQIKIHIFGRVFSIDIGRETPFFEQIYLISIIEEFYDNRDLWYANLIWKFGGLNGK